MTARRTSFLMEDETDRRVTSLESQNVKTLIVRQVTPLAFTCSMVKKCLFAVNRP